ncbi:MAG TPA: SsrA-binding protein SmpB [Thermoanaerobaculia bacterium]|nr:SsrA-binding protein SmpB [Thermoanaerobaculia bacterium]
MAPERARTPSKATKTAARAKGSGGGGEPATRIMATNRRAQHDYQILESFEAGLELQGTEVKAIRSGKVQLKDSFVEFRDSQAYLVGAHISHYSHGNRENHSPERPRRLLLKRRQIERLFGRTLLKGHTVVPLAIYLKGNWIKVEIALARGKKLYDKREAEKGRQLDREAEEAVKGAKW